MFASPNRAVGFYFCDDIAHTSSSSADVLFAYLVLITGLRPGEDEISSVTAARSEVAASDSAIDDCESVWFEN
jgi:hypothetical protein